MSTFAIGDKVALPQGHNAILRWIGRIPGRPPIEYAGVEVIGPEATKLGKHSGIYQGQQYFTTSQPGTGLFVSYTQLVSANIRMPRLAPPASPSLSMDESVTSTASMRFTSPRLRPLSPGKEFSNYQHSRRNSINEKSPVKLSKASSPDLSSRPSSSGSTMQTSQTSSDNNNNNGNNNSAANASAIASLTANLASERAFFRQTIRTTNEKVAELTTSFETKLNETIKSYEQKLMKARRSSALLSSPGASEVEEQRAALAAMQNKLISERAEKEEEISGLKRELAHMRKVAGSAEDLEALVGDLARYERELAELRSQVNEMDQIREEVSKLRTQNANLELEARRSSSQGSGRAPGLSTGSATAVSSPSSLSTPHAAEEEEVRNLEKMLELKLVRESELELQNEQLRAELEALKAARSQPNILPLTPDPEPHAGTATATTSKIKETAPQPIVAAKVPVPAELSGSYEESSMMVDLAAGRSDWCSLCEREGHSAIDCPYE